MVDSIVGNGGGGQVSEPETLIFPLIRLDLQVVERGRFNDKVVLTLQSRQYEVYLKGERLGSVPINYTSELIPQTEYKGRIFEIVAGPNPTVTIEVRKTRISHE